MAESTPIRYRSPDEDSARWWAFPFRDGDIVISTRSKHGTTWMQMIVALLVFRTPELPAPLAELSSWLDWVGAPLGDVIDRLQGQGHRRFVKTHTPLDGLPLDDRGTFVVVARHPLDAAVSLHHQGQNLDRERIAHLTGGSPATAPAPPLHDWLVDWIEADPDPRAQLDSLPGVFHHLSGAWARRHEPNVVLVHYDDLLGDLEGEMRRLAERLGVAVPEPAWPDLVAAAGFEAMRARADVLAPDTAGVLKDRTRFFLRGGSGAGREVLTVAESARYEERAAALGSVDLRAWLHRGPRP